MTLRGFFITLIELLLVILAFGTEIREFYIMAVVVGGMLFYSLFSLLLASITLEVKSQTNKAAAMRGENIEYHLVMTGVALLPVAGYLSVKSAEANQKTNKRYKHSFLMMPTFVFKRKFTFELPCAHVGLWKVGIRKLRFEDVFGLFSLPLIRNDKKDFTADLSVMPKLHYFLDDEQSDSSGGYGNSSFANAEEGELLGDSRIYREGDSLKRINWKQSARAKKLYSRQYEMLQKPQIVVAVDTGFCSENMWDMADIAYETALSLSNFFVEESNPVELIALRPIKDDGNSFFALKNKADIMKIQYNFSNIIYHGEKTALTLNGLEDTYFLRADKIFFITDNPSSELLSDIRDMNKNGKNVKCIVPSAKLSKSEIQEMESGGIITVVTSVDRIAQKVGAVL